MYSFTAQSDSGKGYYIDSVEGGFPTSITHFDDEFSSRLQQYWYRDTATVLHRSYERFESSEYLVSSASMRCLCDHIRHRKPDLDTQ